MKKRLLLNRNNLFFLLLKNYLIIYRYMDYFSMPSNSTSKINVEKGLI